MNYKELLLVLSLLGILVVLFLSQLTFVYVEGKVREIKFLKRAVLLRIEGVKEDVLVFDDFVDLRKGDFVRIQVKTLEKGKSFVAQRIWKLN